MCPPAVRGDDPEALALRPSHVLRVYVATLWRAPCIMSLASGSVQGGLTVHASSERVKYLGQVIFGEPT